MGKQYPFIVGREFLGPFPQTVAIRARSFSERRNNAESAIVKSRADEEKRRELAKFAREHDLLLQKKAWEKHHVRCYRESLLKKKVNVVLDEAGRNLEDRRQRLSEILSKEENDLLNEVQVETVDERCEKNRQKLNMLKEKHEKERLELVDKKLDQQFREHSEELHSLLVRRHQDEVCMDRNAQIAIKAEKARLQQEDNKMYAELWNKDFLAKAAREESEAREEAEKKNCLSEDLRYQLASYSAKKEEEKRLKQEETRLFHEELEIIKQEKENERLYKTDQKRELKKTLDNMIEVKNKRFTHDLEEEKALDAKILAVAQAEKKSDIEEQQQLKIQRKRAQLNYMEHLKDQRKEDKIREKELERLINEDLTSIRDKETMKRRMVSEARKNLLQDVLKRRGDQLQNKIETFSREKEDLKREREAVKKVMEEHLQIERERKAITKLINKQHEADLLAQIRHFEAAKEAEVLEKKREFEEGLQTEKRHQDKLQQSFQ